MFSDSFNSLIGICDSKKYSVSNLLDKFATSRSAINAWKKGNISAGTTAKIAEALDVSIDYLITGQEKNFKMIELTADEQKLLEYFKKLSDISKGIILGRAEQLAELEIPFAKEQDTIFIEFSTLRVSARAAVKINGNSMMPRFKDGDIVLVKSQPDVNGGKSAFLS